MPTDMLMLNLPYHVQRMVRKYPVEHRPAIVACLKQKMVQGGGASSLGWPQIQDCVSKTMKLPASEPNYAETELSLLQYDSGETVAIGELLHGD